jgi:hypothetical protein
MLILMGGCRGIPFSPAERVPLGHLAAAQIRERQNRAWTPLLQRTNTVVFEFRVLWRTVPLATLGIVSVDRVARTFTVVGLNPVGVKLFAVQGKDEGVTAHFLVPQLQQAETAARTIGADIRNIYFDLVPGASATVARTTSELIFRETAPSQVVEYVFAGAQPDLVEKRIFTGKRLLTRIRYYDYRDFGGYREPGGILLESRRYRYRLIIREPHAAPRD